MNPSDQEAPAGPGERLQKVLARAECGSRRKCEDFIAAGRITVNGEVAILGRRVDAQIDRIEFDGSLVVVRSDLIYYLLNKTPGVISAAKDTHNRPTVIDLLPSEPRVFPVGRLDLNSEGIIICTNDGELTHLLTHPSFGVEKEYLVEVGGRPSSAALKEMREGVNLGERRTSPARVKVIQTNATQSVVIQNTATPDAGSTALSITIHEGRKRQIRLMCEAVGHPVKRLIRIRIGPITSQGLSPGEWRILRLGEVRALYASKGAPQDPG